MKIGTETSALFQNAQVFNTHLLIFTNNKLYLEGINITHQNIMNTFEKELL